MKPGRRRQLDPGSNVALTEKRKASIRAKVEHPFLKVKQLFGYAKVRYRGLAKNTQRLALLLGLGNFVDRREPIGGLKWEQWAQLRLETSGGAGTRPPMSL